MGGRIFWVDFKHTTLSAEASGDSVNLCIIPAGARLKGLKMYGNGLGASAASLTVKLTATDDGATAIDITAAINAGSATFFYNQLAVAGWNYTPASGKAVVKATWGTAGPVGAKILQGALEIELPS